MTSVPLHPALVHVPLGIAFALPLVAAGLALAAARGLVTRRAFLLPVALAGILLAGGALALKTGEREEKIVGPVIGERAIEAHEEAAEAFLWGGIAVLLLAAGASALPGRLGRALPAATVVASLAVAGLGYRAGKGGGELVYVRGAALAYRPGGVAAPPNPLAATRHHDDD